MELLDLFALLRKHLALVIAFPVVFALVVGIVTLFMPNEYTASTNMYVLSKSGDTDTITQSDLSVGQMLTNDVAQLITSSRILDDVKNRLGVDSLAGYDFSVSSSTSTRVIKLSVTGKDAQKAADIANAMVESVSETAQEVMDVEAVNVIDKATTPKSPSGPRRALYTLAGAMAGLFLAVALVWFQDTIDTRIRNEEEVREIVGVPVIGHFAQIER